MPSLLPFDDELDELDALELELELESFRRALFRRISAAACFSASSLARAHARPVTPRSTTATRLARAHASCGGRYHSHQGAINRSSHRKRGHFAAERPRQQVPGLVRETHVGAFLASRGSMRVLALAGLLGPMSACSAAAAARAGAELPSRPLPAYAGRSATLFDDTIEPASRRAGLRQGLPAAPRSRRRRNARRSSDAVLRVRVSTVTAKKDGPEAVYQLGLHTVEKLAGKNPPAGGLHRPDQQVERVARHHEELRKPSRGLPVRRVRPRVRSTRSGDREIHFHLAPDTKEVKLAVGELHARGRAKRARGERSNADEVGAVEWRSRSRSAKEIEALRVVSLMAAETLLLVGEEAPRRA